MAKRMVAGPISGAIKAIEYYQRMVQEVRQEKDETSGSRYRNVMHNIPYISELELRKILGGYFITSGDGAGEVDLLEIFIAQLPKSLEPGNESFFRRFRVDDVKEKLMDILKTTASKSSYGVQDDDYQKDITVEDVSKQNITKDYRDEEINFENDPQELARLKAVTIQEENQRPKEQAPSYIRHRMIRGPAYSAHEEIYTSQ